MSKIIDFLITAAKPIVEKHGCELWDAEYVKEAADWYLRLYIDNRQGGVTLDHCEAISRELDPILDANEDIIPVSYTFEVSSAGAERHLRRASDFERFMGSKVEVKLYKPKDGQKVYTGVLTDYENGDITIEIAGTPKTFTKSETAGVRLRIS